MGEPILSCENLTYCENDSCLFQGVSFRLDSGKRGVLLAEPHRCATILLKICATLILPTSGTIRWFGRTAEQHMDNNELFSLRRRIGLVHRETSLISNMTIMDNVSLGLQYHENIALEEAHERIAELLEQLDLYEDRFLRPSDLTFEKRRLAVYARELAKAPQLFLLEHPSLDLGERFYSLLMDIFRTCISENGCSFLVASINPRVVSRWGDWVLILDEGRCEHLEASQFNATSYLESMRRRSTIFVR